MVTFDDECLEENIMHIRSKTFREKYVAFKLDLY